MGVAFETRDLGSLNVAGLLAQDILHAKRRQPRPAQGAMLRNCDIRRPHDGEEFAYALLEKTPHRASLLAKVLARPRHISVVAMTSRTRALPKATGHLVRFRRSACA